MKSRLLGRSHLLGPGPGSGLRRFPPPSRRRTRHASRSSGHRSGRGLHAEEGSRGHVTPDSAPPAPQHPDGPPCTPPGCVTPIERTPFPGPLLGPERRDRVGTRLGQRVRQGLGRRGPPHTRWNAALGCSPWFSELPHSSSLSGSGSDAHTSGSICPQALGTTPQGRGGAAGGEPCWGPPL